MTSDTRETAEKDYSRCPYCSSLYKGRGLSTHIKRVHPKCYQAWRRRTLGKMICGFSLDYYFNLPRHERRVLIVLQNALRERVPRVAKLEKYTFGFVAENGHITALGIPDRALVTLPPSIGALQDLKVLNLRGNQFRMLPDCLGYLQALETIDVSRNRLLQINDFVRELPHIRRILWRKNPGFIFRYNKGGENEDGTPPIPEEEIVLGSVEYYRYYHGFDPEGARTPIAGGFYYEIQFPLENDPLLHRRGVTIAAKVLYQHNVSQNRIVFQRGTRHAEVTCVHTAVSTMTVHEARQVRWHRPEAVLELARSTEGRPVDLPPEEHFAALKSYVQGIAEVGLQNMMGASYHSESVNPQTLPFGFNSAMQNQISRCLAQLVPEVVKPMIQELLLELAESVPEEWFLTRLQLLDATYFRHGPRGYRDTERFSQPMREILFGSRDAFEAFNDQLQSAEFRLLAARSSQTAPEVIDILGEDPGLDMRLALAARDALPPAIYQRLLADPDPRVRDITQRHTPAQTFSDPALFERFLETSTIATVQDRAFRYEHTHPQVLDRIEEDFFAGNPAFQEQRTTLVANLRALREDLLAQHRRGLQSLTFAQAIEIASVMEEIRRVLRVSGTVANKRLLVDQVNRGQANIRANSTKD